MPAVSNTSPLFNLAAIDQLHLLRDQFEEVLIPAAVLDELRPIRDRQEWEKIRQALEEGWISSRTVQDWRSLRTLTLELDQGEAEAIVLALELGLPTVLIDESDGRAAAIRLGLKPTGVLGILLKAKAQGRLDSVKAAMASLQDLAGFYIHPHLFQRVVALAGEL